MKDIIYNIFDIITYLVQGLLLVALLKEAQTRFPFKRSIHMGILLIQYAAVQIFLHHSVWVKSLLYGKSMIISSSRQSIVPVFISMLVTCVAGLLLFRESRFKIIYYVVTFYSLMELLKFAIHPLLLWLFTRLVDLNQYLFLDRQMYGETTFFEVASAIEICWNFVFIFVLLLLMYRIILRLQKYFEMKENYERSQLIFVLFPSVIGMLVCLMIRSMMFTIEGRDIYSLFDSRPEMNLLIPCTSVLCIAMIVFAARMLRKLIDESNQKIEVRIYQDRIREMEQHIGDIENLYAGIRGMKHDMKNYIADMDALMREETKDPSALRQYLDSLQTSVEQLDMKYNTGNPVTDVILQRYVQLAKGSGITFDADFIFPSDMNMDAFDLSIILNNALNNALEACRRQKEGRKFIELNAYRRENMFFIIIKNSFDGTLARSRSDGRLLTTKPDASKHGMGLRNIEMCAQKYYGKAEMSVRENEFELAVMLQKRVE